MRLRRKRSQHVTRLEFHQQLRYFKFSYQKASSDSTASGPPVETEPRSGSSMHCGGLATVVCLLVMPPRKADAPPHPPVPPPSMHPERWAPEQQPAPVPNPKGGLNSKWYVQALVCRKGTGMAANTTIQEKSPRIYAATADLAMMEQQKFINEYLHPSKRTKQQHGGGGCSSTAGSSSSEHTTEPTEPRPSRAAAPNDLKEEQVYAGGPRAGSARAGPGVSAARHGAVIGRPLAVWGRVWGGSRVRAALERGRMPRPGSKRFTDARTRLGRGGGGREGRGRKGRKGRGRRGRKKREKTLSEASQSRRPERGTSQCRRLRRSRSV